eukprot:1550458-Prymnesium_polylepis.2
MLRDRKVPKDLIKRTKLCARPLRPRTVFAHGGLPHRPRSAHAHRGLHLRGLYALRPAASPRGLGVLT